MDISIFKYLDVILTLITIIFYSAFLFLAESLNSKFFIFFISSFMNIFCYSAVLKNEYNFFLVVLLNITIMLVMVFYYFIIDLKEKLLPIDFVSRGTTKYLVIIFSFLFSFFALSFISFSFFKKKNLLFSNNAGDLIRISDTKNNDFNRKISNIYQVDEDVYLYKKKIKILNNRVFGNYNLAILMYTIILSFFYFLLRNKEIIDVLKEEEEEKDKERGFLKEKMEEFENSEKKKRKVRKRIGEEGTETHIKEEV